MHYLDSASYQYFKYKFQCCIRGLEEDEVKESCWSDEIPIEVWKCLGEVRVG